MKTIYVLTLEVDDEAPGSAFSVLRELHGNAESGEGLTVILPTGFAFSGTLTQLDGRIKKEAPQ